MRQLMIVFVVAAGLSAPSLVAPCKGAKGKFMGTVKLTNIWFVGRGIVADELELGTISLEQGQANYDPFIEHKA
jgi:hypothetical protein